MKYLFHGLLCLAAINFSPFESQSQTGILRTENEIFLRIGAGLDFTKIRDTEFSSMLFAGLIPSINVQLDFGNHFHQQVNLGYAGGKIKAENATENIADFKSFSSDYFFSKTARFVEDKRWYSEPGAGINFIYSERRYEDFINQFKSSEFSGSLSIYYKLLYVLSESRGWAISDRIFVPAISVISQPRVWQSSNDEPNSNSDKSMITKVYFVPDYFRINNMITLSRSVNEKHSFHFSYTWDFYQIEEVYRKERIYHSLQLSYQIKF